MPTVEKSIIVKRSLKEVRDFLATPAKLPLWLVGNESVSDITPVIVAGGGKVWTYAWEYRMFGILLSGLGRCFTDPEGKVVTFCTDGDIGSNWRLTLSENGATETRIELHVEYNIPTRLGGKVSELLLKGANETAAQESLENIRKKLVGG